MTIIDLYSKRQHRLRNTEPDVLTYDILPKALRIQIIHILRDVIGTGSQARSAEAYYKLVRDILIKEYGVYELNGAHTNQDEIFYFIEHENDTERVLDGVELMFKLINRLLRTDIQSYNGQVVPMIDEAIEDLNTRFKEHAVGYSFESNFIIRVDSTYTHAEIVKPALTLLSNPLFKGANEEFLNGHEHYRHGRNKECLTDCLKALESTLKTIFTNKAWSFDSKDTANTLITIALNNNLVPNYLQTQLTSLKSVLVSGVPTLRNRLGGHGQGATPTTVEDETARYALNLTGSCITYLVELSKL